MISLRDIELRRGNRVLLQHANTTILPNQKLGLVGSNGSGKTSLFSLLQGKLEAESGELDMPKQLVIAHVEQHIHASDKTALDYVIDGDGQFRDLQKQLHRAEEAGDDHKVIMLHEQINHIDGYSIESRAAQLLTGLGFTANQHNNSVKSFSGGWRMRLNLAKALLCRSDLLLLDEPTNHLDLIAVVWLEQWLKKYSGTLILISHDREFLDNIIDHVAHVKNQTLHLYTGNYSDFEKQRAQQLALQQSMYEKQQKQITHMQSFIRRFKAKASKAKQAQSRIKAIAKMELVAAAQVDSLFQFQFPEIKNCPNPLLEFSKVSVGYGETTILSDINLTLGPGSRLALLGQNGAGKSTLLKSLTGQISMLAGDYHKAKNLSIGYFAQHQLEYLNGKENALQHILQLSPHAREQQIRTFVGGFGFHGDDALKQVEKFSGGEKARLAFALIVWQNPNLLVLDEPTNHLDLEMQQALTLALQSYQGALILVSHDRNLIRTTTDQLMLVHDGSVTIYQDDIDSYQVWLQQQSSPSKKTAPKPTKQLAHQLRKQQQHIDRLEKKLSKLQSTSAHIAEQLAMDDVYLEHNKKELNKLLQQQKDNNAALDESENAWLEAQQQLDNLAKGESQ